MMPDVHLLLSVTAILKTLVATSLAPAYLSNFKHMISNLKNQCVSSKIKGKNLPDKSGQV